ncbi:LacI family DNA-binding transcriptional regulator [Amycolatopsis rhabdoformis]|uniref:LacI family DNA-binding transcriptional regulator n=1 Tax=Amycolatopsis rhabdoformis TaxID=1448059 RepID=A0ABZ1IG56_9PSEU|nr:LacI family DNA-binding transcriptional regulator [Amycolatopsis rhabdoformis]WSE33451.1 LacI family DNA-binding transcriptional regulator [Amycolatopsis rhabdoformis]
MRVTIAEVARRARVSKTTVSRVLNNKSDVDAATAVRVREVIAATGYIPSAGAVSLAKGRTRLVGVLVPALSPPGIGEVLQGVADVVEASDHSLLLSTTNRGADSLERFTRQVRAHAFDGLLLLDPPAAVTDNSALRDSDLPVVVIDGARAPFPSVAGDDAAGAAAVARHFLSRNRRRVAVVTGPGDRATARLAGFRSVLGEAGVPFADDRVAEAAFTAGSGRSAVRRLVASGLVFDAVFACDDVVAAGVLIGLREAGRAVPDDVAVAGFGDLPLSAFTQPPLTTVRRPLRALGEAAARRLLGKLLGDAGETPLTGPTVLPTDLVVRASAP